MIMMMMVMMMTMTMIKSRRLEKRTLREFGEVELLLHGFSYYKGYSSVHETSSRSVDTTQKCA